MIRAMTRRVFSFGAVVAAVVVAATTPADAGWFTARGNAQRTGFSDATGSIATPGIRWKYYLGGSVGQRTMRAVAGTSAPGSDDLVYLAAASRVEARRPDDILVWQSPLDGVDHIIGVTDLDGDGRNEVVALSRFSGRAYVYDAATGAILWSSPVGRYTQIGVAYLRDIDGDGLADLYLSDWGSFSHAGSRWADVWNFAGALAHPSRPVAIDMMARDYDRAETEAWADVDGDGRAELVAFGSQTVYVYSSVDGALIASGNVGWIPYAQAQTIVANVDGAAEPGDEIAIFTDLAYGAIFSTRHVMVLDVAGGAVTVRWERSVADVMADHHAFTGESVVDADGDGALDVVSSFYAGATGTWTTNVWRASDGAAIASMPGQFVGAVDADGDGAAEVFTRPGPNLLGVTAWDIVGTTAIVKWMRGDAQWLVEADPATEQRQSLSSRSITIDVDADGHREVVIGAKQANGSWQLQAYDLSDSSPTAKRTYPITPEVTLIAIQRRTLEQGENLLVGRSDGFLAVLDHNLVPTNEWHYPGGILPGMKIGGYLSGWRGLGIASLSADLLGDASDDLVVRDSRGAVLALDASGATVSNPPDIAWQVSGQRWYPALVDVTGDGRPEVATGDVGQVSVRTATTGARLWAASVTGDTGHLTGHDLDGDGREEVVYFSYDGATNDQVFGARTPTGAAAWAEQRFASSGRGSFAFGELDGDGVDDAVVQFGAYLRTIDGATGAVIQHGYTGILSMAPLVADVDDDGDQEILSSGFIDNYQTFDVDASGGWASRGGVINDPSTEVAAYHYGALVTCPEGRRFVFAAQNSSHLRAVDPDSLTRVLDMYLAGGAAYTAAADVPATSGPAFLGNVNAVASLDGDGEPRLLVNSTDGYLYALRACATSAANAVVWRIYLGAAVGEAIPADIDDDGQVEIVVAAADGYLYAIDGTAMAAPTNVGEVASAGTLASAELDELDGSSGITVEWNAVVGAIGYEVAIFDGVGAPMTRPTFVAVGPMTSARLQGVALTPDLPYFTVVRAIGADGKRSFEQMSDGFRIRASTAPEGVDGATPDDAGRDEGGGCQTNSGGAGELVVLGLTLALRRRRAR